MRLVGVIIAIVTVTFLKAQQLIDPGMIPVFRPVNYPFLPPITSPGFYFSEDGLMWLSTSNGLTSFDGTSVLHHSTVQQATDLNLIRIDAFAEDKNHNLYLGTRKGSFFLIVKPSPSLRRSTISTK